MIFAITFTIGALFMVVITWEDQPEPEFINVCVESHKETQMIMIPQRIGDITIMQQIPQTVTVCDKYEEQRNPNFIGK